MPLAVKSGVWISAEGTAREMQPSWASGLIGAATTMWAQQHRHPSPEHPSSESPVLWLWAEKMQESGEISWQARISVAAVSRTSSVTTRRTADQYAIKLFFIITQGEVGTMGPPAFGEPFRDERCQRHYSGWRSKAN
jgi:hypothetical protein